MAKLKDKRELHKELQKINATPLDYKMTAILLSVNGFESAMKFVKSITIKQKGE